MRLLRSIILIVITVAVLMGLALAGQSRGSSARERGLRIYRLYPNEFKDELVIYGRFGAQPGEVLMNDKPLKLDQPWDERKLVCALPRFGDQAAGNVTVQVGTQKSNMVQLTEWRGRFTFLRYVSLGTSLWETPLTFQAFESAEINLHIRADLHRGEPSEADITPEGPLAPMRPAFPKGVLFVAAKDSTCALIAEGSGTLATLRGDDVINFEIKDPPGPAVKLWDDFPETSGEGENASAGTSRQRAAERGFLVLGSIDVEARKLYLDLHEEAPEGGKVRHSLPPTARNVNDTFPIHFQTHDVIDPLDPDVDEVVVALDSRFGIKAGKATRPEPNIPEAVKKQVEELRRAAALLTPASTPAILEWSNIAANFPPRE